MKITVKQFRQLIREATDSGDDWSGGPWIVAMHNQYEGLSEITYFATGDVAQKEFNSRKKPQYTVVAYRLTNGMVLDDSSKSKPTHVADGSNEFEEVNVGWE
jgi:hypothetical protein